MVEVILAASETAVVGELGELWLERNSALRKSDSPSASATFKGLAKDSHLPMDLHYRYLTLEN